MAVNLVGGMLLGGAAKPKSENLGNTATDRKLTLRSNIESRKLVYGRVMVSGPLALKTTTGSTKQFLHLVVPVAARKVAKISELTFDSTLATATRVSAKNRVKTHLGSVRQEADADLVAEVPGWSTAHRGRGVAYIYARLEYDSNAWPNGVKNVKGVVQGLALYDPRLPLIAIASTDAGSPALLHTVDPHGLAVDDEVFLIGHDHLAKHYVVDSVPSTTSLTLCDAVSGAPVALSSSSTGGSISRMRWSNNAALAVLDYILWVDGLNANLAEINADYWIAAANACDEQVQLGAESACTASAATDVITLAQAVPWQTGLAVRMSTTGALPGGVDGAKSYAWVRLSPTTGKLAATKEDALYGLGIDITGAGSGVHTLSCALSCTLSATAGSVTLADDVPRDDDNSNDADQDEISPQFGWDTGDGVRLVSGTPPAGLSLGTTYYWIALSNSSGQLAASHEDAIAGNALDISAAGSGLCIARVSQPRYTANGVVDLGAKPIDNMEKLLTACGGMIPYVQGRYRLHPAVAQASTFTLTDSDARGPIKVQARPSKRDVFNAVRGTFVDPTQLWEPTDLPAVTSAQYQDEDGGEQIWKDVELPFTTDCLRGQRLLKIILECGRQGMTVEFPARLTAGPGSTLAMAPWDVGSLYINLLGFAGKQFQLHTWSMAEDMGVDLMLQEYAPQALDWDPSEARHPDYAPNTALANPWDVAAPTGLALASGTDVLAVLGDGTVQTRLRATWTPPADAFVLSGGSIEIQVKKSADEIWSVAMVLPGDASVAYLLDVEDGVAYDLRLRAKNRMGASSSWAVVTGHVVLGKSQPPPDVPWIQAQVSGNVVTSRWGGVSVVDLGGYRMRAAPKGSFDWATALDVSSAEAGTLLATADLTPGEWTLGIKALDTSGNESVHATTCDITVVTSNWSIASQAQHPAWPGAATGVIKDPLTGLLIPQSQSTLEDITEITGTWATNPVESAVYVSPEIDTGSERSMRVFADMAGLVSPGSAQSVADSDLHLEVRSREEGGEYGAWARWLVGDITGRYVQFRATWNPALCPLALQAFTNLVDAPTRIEEGEIVVPAGGMPVSFSAPFASTPNVELVNASGLVRFPVYSSPSASGFDIHVYDVTETSVGGTARYKATGV